MVHGLVEKQYTIEMEKEYNEVKPYLPKKIETVLDIGCGMAGIDVTMAQQYPAAHYYLVDKTQNTNPVYDFQKFSEFYNDNNITEHILRENGVKNFSILDKKEDIPSVNYDCIFSLYSVGFHYSLHEYIDTMSLATDGVMLIDIRKNRGQEEILSTRFRMHTLIEREFSKRLICKRK